MKKQRIKTVALSTVIAAGAFFVGAAQADRTFDAILQVSQSKIADAKKSQARIDRLASDTADLLQEFKIVNKQIEGLRVYNAQLERQLANQRKVINELEQSIDQVTVIERQIQPLIARMIEGLEQFVQLDIPFRKEERLDRIEKIKDNQDRADITVAEKFRQVLEAYNIEAEYGRKIDTYLDTLPIGGTDRQVNILSVGRVALMYQTTDTQLSGVWDQDLGQWVELDSGTYRSGILNGIKIAKKQASIDVMKLPVAAPEEAK